jgi:hypothetical protein
MCDVAGLVVSVTIFVLVMLFIASPFILSWLFLTGIECLFVHPQSTVCTKNPFLRDPIVVALIGVAIPSSMLAIGEFAYQVYYKDVLKRIARKWKAKLGKVEDIEDV